MPCAVDGIGACLQDIAEDDMIDPLRLDAGLLKRAREAMAPSSIADTSFSAPTYSVIGVRAPPRIKTSIM
jgi:hypothetical protein